MQIFSRSVCCVAGCRVKFLSKLKNVDHRPLTGFEVALFPTAKPALDDGLTLHEHYLDLLHHPDRHNDLLEMLMIMRTDHVAVNLKQEWCREVRFTCTCPYIMKLSMWTCCGNNYNA